MSRVQRIPRDIGCLTFSYFDRTPAWTYTSRCVAQKKTNVNRV